jgi:AAA family ATP:ADP antiporter
MIDRQLRRLTGLAPGEGTTAVLAALLFFFLMAAYFILKPLRDEMGIAGGVKNLPNLYLFTLAAMLVAAPAFGWLSRGRRRESFIPAAYHFFAANLVVFFLLLGLRPASEPVVGRVFFVWVSVFNLFTLSLFWGYMADGFGVGRARRALGLVAVGGTVGALAGSSLTALLVSAVGRLPLLLVSAGCLEIAVGLVLVLSRRFAALTPLSTGVADRPRGGILAGITLTLRSPYLQAISAFLVLYSLTSTFVYFEQATLVEAAERSRVGRAGLLAGIELCIQGVTLALQLFGSGRIVTRIGVGLTLALLPVLTGLGFLALAFAPVLGVLIGFQVVRKAANYALVKPAREALYAPLGPDEKYRAKSFIDTFVYRGGDAGGAAFFGRLQSAGLGHSGVALVGTTLAALWTLVALHLGRRHQRLAQDAREPLCAPADPC